jgi:PadR family transcriptional regulator, regulatory protein PadR
LATREIQLVQGTLELLILRTLGDGEQRHGFEIMRWISSASDGALSIEEGALYPALHRMERRGWLESAWGVSENNRRAKYYALTEAGRARLAEEVTSWEAYVEVLARLLSGPSPRGAR